MKINRHLVLLVVPLFLFLSPSCSSAQQKGTEIQLKSKNFKRLVDKSISFSIPLISVEDFALHKNEYIIFDTREIEEYNVSHIQNAKFIGYDAPEMEVLASLDKDKKLLFYCSIGYRSEKIAEKARDLGFLEVYNLYGGIFEWTNTGLELESFGKEKTKRVHAYNWIWGQWLQNDNYEKVY